MRCDRCATRSPVLFPVIVETSGAEPGLVESGTVEVCPECMRMAIKDPEEFARGCRFGALDGKERQARAL